SCELCGTPGHKSVECQAGNPFAQPIEQVDYAGNFQRPPQNNPYSNTYNPGWRNHPNFSWSNQQNPRPPPPGYKQPHPQQQQQQKPSLEDLMSKCISTSEARFQNQDASIKNLETQIGQLAKIMSEKAQSASPSNAEPKLKEHVKAITLRSGKELPDKQIEMESKELEKQEEPVVKPEKTNEKNKGKLFADEVIREYKPRIPYPQKPKQEKLKEQYGKFLDLFKQLHINLPFVDALTQMPNYAKFLKEILSNKRKLEDVSTVTLNEECSAILQNKLLQKLKDPESFTIPCVIGTRTISKALADLGASINLMPYSLFKTLNLGEPKPTKMSIQLADRSIRYPKGIMKDMLVKVDKLIFPVDFVIMEMEEDFEVSVIIGRSFLATTKALIDVAEGRLTLRIQDEE